MSVSSLIKCLVRSFQFKSVAQSCLTLCHPMDCSTPCPSPTPGAYSDSCSSSRWCHPTISFSVIPFSSCLQSFPASVFSNESVLRIKWPKYWRFSFSISPSNEYWGLISFRMDYLELLATPWTAARQASLSITNTQSLLKLMSIESVSDAIQPSDPLSSPSSPAFNLSQHQGLFKWVSSLYQVTKVLEFQL